MVSIKAFKAIRPVEDLAKEISALPYDVYSISEAREKIKENPYSFLQVDLPASNFDEDIDPYSDEVYKKALEKYNDMKDKGYFLQDDEESLYIYELTKSNRKQIGLICCASVDDYLEGTIKTHEKTRPIKEEDRTKHIDILNAQTGPIFLTCENNIEIEKLIKKTMKEDRLYDFVTDDGVSHRIWKIKSHIDIASIIKEFKNIPNLYIADGHHRSAAAVNLAVERRKKEWDELENKEYNYFLSIIFPMNQVKIYDYNRVVKDLNGLKEDDFIERVKENFIIESKDRPCKPDSKGTFGMYLSGKWYKLGIKKDKFKDEDVLEALDVSILQNFLLEPILGIKDPRTDERIDFVGGVRGLEELQRQVDRDMKVAFSMYPTSIEEIVKVADKGGIMPPKSTWFEPKPRSGIFIHDL